jgi:hypothetical protein
MRWTTTILAAVVVGAIAWWVAAGPYRQDGEVAATVAVAAAGLVVAVLTHWANGDRRTNGGSDPHRASIDAADTQQRPGAHQLVVGDLPGQAVAWQERVETVDRLAVMAGNGQTTVVCALAGQRGIGKTQLAAAYARGRVAEGWPVVVWVAAETEHGIVTGLDALAAEVGLRQPDTDPADAALVALAWLRTPSRAVPAGLR